VSFEGELTRRQSMAEEVRSMLSTIYVMLFRISGG
jgi:hypothetical protein